MVSKKLSLQSQARPLPAGALAPTPYIQFFEGWGMPPGLGVKRSELCSLYGLGQLTELLCAYSQEIRQLSWMSPNMRFKHHNGQEMVAGGTLAKNFYITTSNRGVIDIIC